MVRRNSHQQWTPIGLYFSVLIEDLKFGAQIRRWSLKRVIIVEKFAKTHEKINSGVTVP